VQIKTLYGSKVDYLAHSREDSGLIYIKDMGYTLPMLISDLEEESKHLVAARLEKDLTEGVAELNIFD
jgi:hypothetical protein